MRLPSFNDFSPGIIGDVRRPLQIALDSEGKFDDIVVGWANAFFGGEDRKRARTNVSATLGNLGLFDRTKASLTDQGRRILEASSAKEAARHLVRHIIETHNGMRLIDAITALRQRTERITKDSLKRELKSQGIEELSSGTTDHTTLANWMAAAGVLEPKPSYAPIGEALKTLLGISAEERSEFQSLSTAQQIFLKILRRVVEPAPTGPVPSKLITDECLRDFPAHFDDDQFSAKVTRPLADGDWIMLAGRSGSSSGGKAGTVTATAKLLSIPIGQIIPDFETVIPADLRRKINLPLSEIKTLLYSESKNDRGLGLELLTLRMLIDLNLEPRSFRKRAKDTAYAELDLTAEGASLIFSRWNWQCKCITSKVNLGDVAKEVGLAIYSRSHVVAMVTTSDFSREATNYATEIAASTHLQFLFIKGAVVKAYLKNGPPVLLDHVTRNAADVMKAKRQQPINPEHEEIERD